MNAAHAVIVEISHVQNSAGVPHCKCGGAELRQGATGAVRIARHPTARQRTHCPSGESKGANAVAGLLHHVAHSTAAIQGNVSGAIELCSHPNAIGSTSSATTRQGGDQARGQDFAHTMVATISHVHDLCIRKNAVRRIKCSSSAHAIRKCRASRASQSAHQASGGDAPHAIPAKIANIQAQCDRVHGHAMRAIELRRRALPVHRPRHPTPRQRAHIPHAGKLRSQPGQRAGAGRVAGQRGRGAAAWAVGANGAQRGIGG